MFGAEQVVEVVLTVLPIVVVMTCGDQAAVVAAVDSMSHTPMLFLAVLEGSVALLHTFPAVLLQVQPE
jgi:hypothetical protein